MKNQQAHTMQRKSFRRPRGSVTVPHVACEVEDFVEALTDQKVIIEPNSPSPGVMVAFIEIAGAPVELLQFDRTIRHE